MRVEATEPQAAQPASSPTQLAEAEELLGQVFPSFEGRTRADTEQALRDFQVTRGLEPHGRLDGETLDQLRRAADWIRHETRGNEPAIPTHGHPRPARPTIDTHHAMLAKSLDAKVTPSAPSPSPDEVLELEFRAPSQAERIILAGLLGGSGAWEHLRDLAVRFEKTIVVGLGGDVSAGFERGAVSGGVYFGPDGEIGLTGSIGFGGTTLQRKCLAHRPGDGARR